MRIKGVLTTAAISLLALALLAANFKVSSLPLSPYIMIVPEKTIDSTLTPGNSYTITLYTNYAGSDVWSWQFSLTFNPSVLQGVSVTNGDLITTANHTSARFTSGTFNNTAGKLSTTAAYFYYTVPPPFVTSGPGILATVNFSIIGYGSSDIALGAETLLIGYAGFTYNIIDAFLEPDNIGHGFLSNKLIGDVNGDRTVSVWDVFRLGKAYGSDQYKLNWDADCDFNHDFYVDASDLAGLSSNYGTSI